LKRFVASAFVVAALAPLSAGAQQSIDLLAQEPQSLGEGWLGFTDFAFLINTVLTLVLATVLGAVLAYHPRRRQTADTVEEIEAPKVFVTYAVIGALIGILVVKYGLVVGFVLFGIGGLIRFRTVMASPSMTGQVIYVTLIGLACGLDLPHVAVLATAFAYVLIYLLDAKVTYRISVNGLAADRVAEAAAAYRGVLEQNGCRIVSEKKSPLKERITFVFRSAASEQRGRLVELLETQVDPALRGAVDWEIE
jgi:hypothetical protein